MSDKDEFTFDDQDNFPEPDLNSAFEEGEHQASEPPEPASKDGNSRTSVLLLVLLLVIVCAGGAYYFMVFWGSTPEAPKRQAKTQKTVALPPKPAKQVTEVPQPDTKQMSKPAPAAGEPVKTVDVPPPPKPEPVVKEESIETPAPKAAVASPEPVVEEAKSAMKPESEAVAPPPALSPAPNALSGAAGPYMLDAGSYLLDANRKRLVQELHELGYEPQITPVEAKVAMIRLNLGTFPESEAQEALDFVRTIEPGAFSMREGDQFVIYAGTFFSLENVEKLQKRFLQEGIDAEAQPVEVVRTLNRIRFGHFATAEEAKTAAGQVAEAGVQATIVKVE